MHVDESSDESAGESSRNAAHAQMISDHEERLATARANAIAAGKRKGGLAGAAMAGAMFAVSEIIEGPPKEDAPVTVEASSDPHDLDKDGLDVTVDGIDVGAPPLERLDPLVSKRQRRR